MSQADWVSQPVQPPSSDLAEQESEALRHLKSAVRLGVPWHQALLEAVGLWTLPQEVYQDRTYQYLIEGEAFDWLVLAERLCAEMDGVIPAEEKERLLFRGVLPLKEDAAAFRDFLGASKYRGYLNYWYGVVVEEALQLAVEDEVRKRHRARGYSDSEDLVEDAFTQLYGETRTALLEEFRLHAHIRRNRGLTLSDLKGFTYWLFKRRVNMWDPARVGSDARKGIRRLQALESSQEPPHGPETIEAQPGAAFVRSR